ncbi:MAG: hypothetical protein NVS1B13_23820 [Flavisolibacter sp.]
MIPGEYFIGPGHIQCNVGRPTLKIIVVNTGDRPIQVGSHFHFFEVNRQMQFDRLKSFGMRLNIAAGTAVRFEPGEEKSVELVCFGGNQKVFGFNGLTQGETDSHFAREKAMEKLKQRGFKNKEL